MFDLKVSLKLKILSRQTDRGRRPLGWQRITSDICLTSPPPPLTHTKKGHSQQSGFTFDRWGGTDPPGTVPLALNPSLSDYLSVPSHKSPSKGHDEAFPLKGFLRNQEGGGESLLAHCLSLGERKRPQMAWRGIISLYCWRVSKRLNPSHTPRKAVGSRGLVLVVG